MTLREKQSEFARNVGKLITWCYENGYEISFGEALRTEEQQLLYFEGYTIVKAHTDLHFAKAPRKTKTMASNHLLKLAIDLNIFIDGQLIYDKKKLQPIGDYWGSLHPTNEWGGNWESFYDCPHFEMKP